MAEENPKVFRYWNGTAHVFLDPSETRRRLIHELGGKYLAIIADYSAGIEQSQPDAEPTIDPEMEPVRNQATEHIVAASRTVFELPKVDKATGQGVQEDHAIAVFWSFLDFCEDAKKKREDLPTGLPSSVVQPSPDLSPITTSLASTSTSTDCNCNPPSP